MNIHHHLDEATLVSYTAGSMTNAMALVVASHLSMCAQCRVVAAELEVVGAAMLERLAPVDINDDCLNDVLAMIDQELDQAAGQNVGQDSDYTDSEPRRVQSHSQSDMPYPLSDYVEGDLADIPWKRMGPGMFYYDLECHSSGVSRLLKLSPGKCVLPHTHNGNELTLVLKGSYSDELGRYTAGDIADLDDEVSHQPLVDSDEPCICLVATDAPLKFNTLLGRLVQPMTGF